MPGQLMPIGAFARMCRLTVKSVRHYDAEGLLAPAVVDERSGYRYYRADQVPTATTIAVLRGLDVPLPVVREVLAASGPEGVAAVLAVQRERWAAELARREEVLRNLDGLLRRPERVRYDVTIADRAPLRLTGVTGPVRASALDADTGALCLRAGAGDLVAVFPLDLADTMDVTVGRPAHRRPRGPGHPAGGRRASMRSSVTGNGRGMVRTPPTLRAISTNSPSRSSCAPRVVHRRSNSPQCDLAGPTDPFTPACDAR